MKVPHHEENVSAESYQAAQEAWVPRADEDPFGSSDPEAAKSQGAQALGDHRGVQVVVVHQTGRFERADRLLDSKDFNRVSRGGFRAAAGEFVMLMTLGGSSGRRRLGISASRRVGNAVVRNRIKRGVRDWFRRERSRLPAVVDLVVIARPKAKALVGGDAIDRALEKTLARAKKQWEATP